MRGDVDSYLDALEQISQAINYMKNKNFKNAESETNHLKKLRQKGLEECEKTFSSLLSKYSIIVDFNRPINSSGVDTEKKDERVPHFDILSSGPSNNSLTYVDPDTLTMYHLIKQKGIAEMKKLMKIFKSLNHFSFLKEYKEKRSRNLNLMLRKLSPDKIMRHETSQMGSHSFIYFLKVYMKLLETEKLLCGEFIENKSTLEETFLEIVEPCVELLVEIGEGIIKNKKNQDKGYGVFALLDIYGNFSTYAPPLKILLKSENATTSANNDAIKMLDEILELWQKFSLSARKCIEEFENYVNSTGENTRNIPPDGTVHQLTSNVCVFFKRISEFRTIVEEIFQKDDKNFLGHFFLKCLGELNKNLESKAKKEKGILANIFLLNNFHYIQKTIQTTELWRLVENVAQSQLLSQYEKYMKEQKDIYISNYKPLLQAIDRDGKEKDDDFRLERNNSMASMSSTSTNIKWPKKEIKAIKSRFTAFNKEIKELHDTQKKYFIPDPELRKLLRTEILNLVVKLYSKFYEEYEPATFWKDQKQKNKYIIYTRQTLESMFANFFEGGNDYSNEMEISNQTDLSALQVRRGTFRAPDFTKSVSALSSNNNNNNNHVEYNGRSPRNSLNLGSTSGVISPRLRATSTNRKSEES
jgi:hypothetical protein